MAKPTEPPEYQQHDGGDDDRRGAPPARRRRQRPPTRGRRTRRHKERDERDDPRAFALIIERRWVGSAPPTAERYALALRQWAALPGAITAVQTTATFTAPAVDDRPPSTETASGLEHRAES
jgi:hypothetical protein